MIIQNGTIEVKTKVGGSGIDPATGFPVRPTDAVYGKPIPCQYSANQYNQLGRVRGESFTIANYTILIEQPALSFVAEQIRLKDMAGKTIGDFSIMSVEPLEAVCELRITV